MNFKFSTYQELIEFALLQKQIRELDTTEYYEIHHILPKSSGGTDKDGLVKLLLKEHVMAHYLYAQEHIEDKRTYCSNLTACLMILGYKKSLYDSFELKRKSIEEFLKEDGSEELITKIKLARRGIPTGRKGMPNINAQTANFWVQYHNQKPLRCSEENSLKREQEGWTLLGYQCPICTQPNSRESFACCKEHEIEYFRQLKEADSLRAAEHAKKVWKENDNSKRLEKIGKANSKPANFIWITDGIENKQHPKDTVVPEGWSKGRIVEGHKRTEEQKAKLKGKNGVGIYIHKDNIVKRIKPEELENYILDGWGKGSIDRRINKHNMTRETRKPRSWIWKGTEELMAEKITIPELLLQGWNYGRNPELNKKS